MGTFTSLCSIVSTGAVFIPLEVNGAPYDEQRYTIYNSLICVLPERT